MLEELLAEVSIDEEFVRKFVEDRFTADATVLDFKLTGAVFSLRTLPPSYARTAIVKCLRGSGKNKVVMNRPEFGIVKGNKKYKIWMLNVLVDDVMTLLHQGDALETEDIQYDPETEERPPEFMNYGDSQHLVDKDMCNKMGKIFTLMGDKHGKKE